MFLSLCLFAVTPVSCSYLLSLKTARGLVHLICFAPLCWRKRGANPPQLAICTGSCLQSSAERLWRVDMSTLRTGFVSSRAGCCCKQLDAAWFGGGPKSPVRPSLAATLAVLVGQDRMPWYPITLPMPNPCPHGAACSLIEV